MLVFSLYDLQFQGRRRIRFMFKLDKEARLAHAHLGHCQLETIHSVAHLC